MSSPIFAASTPHVFWSPATQLNTKTRGSPWVTVGHRGSPGVTGGHRGSPGAPRSCPPAAPGRPPRQRGRAACGRPRRRRRCRWSGPTAPDTDTGETGETRGDRGRPKKEVLGKMWTAGNVWDGDDSRWLFVGRWGSKRLALEEHVSTLVTGNKNIIKECWEMTDQQWLSSWHRNGQLITWEVGFQVLTGQDIPGTLVGLQEMVLSICVAKNWDTSLI